MPTASLISFDPQGNPIEDKIEKYEIKEEEILFDALEDQDKTLPHGCLAGSCGSCRIVVTQGKENLSKPRAIETDTIEHLLEEYRENKGEDYIKGQLRLACRARVQGDITFGPIK